MRMGSGEESTTWNFVDCTFARSPNIVRVIQSRRLRWAGHVAGMEEGRSVRGKPTGKRPFGEA